MIRANLAENLSLTRLEVSDFHDDPGLCPQPKHFNRAKYCILKIIATCYEHFVFYATTTMRTSSYIEIRLRFLLPLSRISVHDESLCQPGAITEPTSQDNALTGKIGDAEIFNMFGKNSKFVGLN